MASSVIEKSLAADFNTLNQKLPAAFCIKSISGAGLNNTIYFPWPSDVSESAEHILFIYGVGAGQKLLCAIVYARKSANMAKIKSLGDVTMTSSCDSDGVYIQGITYMSCIIVSRYDITPSYVTT